MRIVTLNANGIRAAAKKGVFDWLNRLDPDVVCIQETKAHENQLSEGPFFPEGYHCAYVNAQKPGYSGVAIYSKHQPKQIIKEMGYAVADTEGRYIQFDYHNLSVVSLYLPSGTSGEGRQAVKFDFLEQFAHHLQALKSQGRELIVCGDYNIAHKEIDLKNWKTNKKTSGFLPEERAWMETLLNQGGFFDAFRIKNQEADQYTWWSTRTRAFDKNVGWRIDYQIITEGLKDSIKQVSIYKDERFSDHAPVVIDYDGEYFV